jgi:hypothetical protein
MHTQCTNSAMPGFLSCNNLNNCKLGEKNVLYLECVSFFLTAFVQNIFCSTIMFSKLYPTRCAQKQKTYQPPLYSCCLRNKTVNSFCINTVFCPWYIIDEGTKNVVNPNKSYQTREWLDHFLVEEVQEKGAVMTVVSVEAVTGSEPARRHFQAWMLWDSQHQCEKQSPDKQV